MYDVRMTAASSNGDMTVTVMPRSNANFLRMGGVAQRFCSPSAMGFGRRGEPVPCRLTPLAASRGPPGMSNWTSSPAAARGAR